MNIEIGKEWKITTDACNYILNRKAKEKEEKTRKGDGWKVHGYYGEIEYLVDALVELSILGIEADSMAELIKGIKRLKKTLTASICGVAK